MGVKGDIVVSIDGVVFLYYLVVIVFSFWFAGPWGGLLGREYVRLVVSGFSLAFVAGRVDVLWGKRISKGYYV